MIIDLIMDNCATDSDKLGFRGENFRESPGDQKVKTWNELLEKLKNVKNL